MEKTMTMNLRVNPDVKKQAEAVLRQLGLSMASAVDIYLRQIALTGGIPFYISLPKAPDSVNADLMSDERLRNALAEGFEDMKAGRVHDAHDAFEAFRKAHS